ncbi:hypothetical protein ACFLVN_06095, partial [Chloroflexota bacterium]
VCGRGMVDKHKIVPSISVPQKASGSLTAGNFMGSNLGHSVRKRRFGGDIKWSRFVTGELFQKPS